MADADLELPPLQRRPGPVPPFPRKRGRQDDVISSDPPLFSSDDLPEAAENYESIRPKTILVGPWWSDGKKTMGEARKKKRKFKRNLDSGVLMASEGTECS